MEMVAALKARREALEDKLKEKEKLLKELCIKEGELTGELPPEIPLAPGEPAPQIRRRVGTEFALSETLLRKPALTKEEEAVGNLELEFEIQSKIAAAALKLATDVGAPKSVRKQRKTSYQQSQRKLREIESKLNALKYFGTKQRRAKQRGEDDDEVDGRDTVSLSPYQGGGAEDSLRKGLSVPDLEVISGRHHQPRRARRRSESASSLDEDDDDAVSPRSCPSSPRKHSVVLPNKGQMDTRSLEPNSPHR